MDSTDTLSRSCCRERRLNKQVNSINALSRSRCRERRLKIPKKYGEKWFSIWRMKFLHPAMWHDHDIDFARWLHPAMWHVDDVALESWYWIHPSGSTLHCGRWLWIRPNVHHIGILHLVSISTTSPPSTCHYASVSQILPTVGRKKITSCRFSRRRISAILDFRGPITGSLKSPCTTSYRSSIDTEA